MPMFPMVFLSQQRALWVGTIFSIFIVGGLAFLKEEISVAKMLRFILITLTILTGVVLLILLLDKYLAGSVLLTAFSRIQSLLAISIDKSANIRIAEIMRTLQHWQTHFVDIFIGTGLGDTRESVDFSRTVTHFVDNTYVFILWKMGLVGLATFLIMNILLLKRGYYIFTKSTVEKYKQLTAGLLAGWSGLLVVALTNTCLVLYRFAIVWALVFATLEMLYLKVQNEKRRSLVPQGAR